MSTTTRGPVSSNQTHTHTELHTPQHTAQARENPTCSRGARHVGLCPHESLFRQTVSRAAAWMPPCIPPAEANCSVRARATLARRKLHSALAPATTAPKSPGGGLGGGTAESGNRGRRRGRGRGRGHLRGDLLLERLEVVVGVLLDVEQQRSAVEEEPVG